jgi:hypothetical protein
MAAPLRSWSHDAAAPDGTRWSVVVAVPYGDSTARPDDAEHELFIRRATGLRRRALHRQRVRGEAAAEALANRLADAVAAGWQPDKEAPPQPG